MRGIEIARAGVDRIGEYRTNLVKDLEIRRRVTPRRAADRRLIDQNHVADLPVAIYVVKRIRLGRSFAAGDTGPDRASLERA